MDEKAKLPQELSSEIKEKFGVDNNTLGRHVKDDPTDRISIQIGDHFQPDFKPQVKISRWDNEVNASFRYVDTEDGVAEVKTEGKVVKYIKPKTEFHIYELNPNGSQLEDGGVEIELLLKEKPDNNIFEFSIETKGLDFYLQRALTQEEINRGDLQPENVIGSYAVYHSTKKNHILGQKNYKTGKAFHIYRPKAIDADGKEIWGELELDQENGVLRVIIDKQWLKDALYPVIIDPTFGYTTIGSSSTIVQINQLFAGLFTLSEAATVNSITAHQNATGSGGGNFKGVIGNSSGNLVTNGVTDPGTFIVDAWNTADYSSMPELTAADYYLGIAPDANFRISMETSGGTSLFDLSNSYATPANFGDGSADVRVLSIYATYNQGTPTLEQHSFQFRGDDGGESGATSLAGLNTNISRGKNINTRLRVLINATSDPSSKQFQLEFRKKTFGNTESWAEVGT